MLRKALRADIPAMHRIRMAVTENRLTSIDLTEADYVAALDSGSGWIVEEGDVPVGFAVVNAATGNIWALFVDPAHEGHGYGRQLHDAMIAWILQRDGPTPWLTTERGTRAERFYEAAGWTRIGTTETGEVRFEFLPGDR